MATNNSSQRLGYSVNQPLTEIFTQPIISRRDPTVNDRQKLGTLWVNKLLDQTYIITSVVNNQANWAPVSQAAGALNSLTVDGGGIAVPIAGTIDIIGDGNTATSLTGASEITISLNPSPTFAGTVTAADMVTGDLTVSGDFDLNSAAQIDLTSSLAAANAILLNATAGGVSIQAAGNPIALTTTNQAINLVSGTGAVNVGADAAAKTVTVGNVTGASALALNAGTGDITAISIDAITMQAGGAIQINSAGGQIALGNSADAQPINIGTGAAARTITMGNVTGATALVLNSGTGGVAVNTTGAGDVVVTSADTVLIDSAGVLELNSSGGVISVGNDAVAQNINVGTGAAARTITVGNATGATSISLNVGTGALNLGTSATAHATNVGSTTAGSTVVINSPANTGLTF